MLRGMDWWTFGGADASIASTWFGFRHARLLSCCPWMYSGFEFWVLCFRVLGALCFGCCFRALHFRNYPSLMTSITFVTVLHQPQVREQGTWISSVNITFILKLFAIFITTLRTRACRNTSLVNANFSVNQMSPIICRWKLVKHRSWFGDNRRTKDSRKIQG